MQPYYSICWSDEFMDDVARIIGDIKRWDEIFAGHDFNLSRLPRGPGTWDLTPTGDYRLAWIEGGKLEDGTDYPTIYFTFRLFLGPAPYLLLLRARRGNDPELS
jgi:hypothetical protein